MPPAGTTRHFLQPPATTTLSRYATTRRVGRAAVLARPILPLAAEFAAKTGRFLSADDRLHEAKIARKRSARFAGAPGAIRRRSGTIIGASTG
jgi:hypothetical protein